MDEIEVFRKKFGCVDFRAYPMKLIMDRSLLDLYELFKKVTDNAHTNKENVVIYFLLQDDDRVNLLWTCSHYEGTHIESLSGLLHFLLNLKHDMEHETGGGEIHVQLLDGFWEKLLIQVYNAPFRFPEKPEDVLNRAIYGG